MKSTTETSGDCKRGYFRVRCRVPIRTRLVRTDEISALENEILQREDQPSLSELDPDVSAWLDRIERKLDQVLRQLGTVDEELRPAVLESVVLSGSGIRLAAPTRCELGAVMLVELELPGPPAHPVRCLASVVASEDDPTTGYQVALAFRTLHASDREAIVRHTLAVERGERRSRIDEHAA